MIYSLLCHGRAILWVFQLINFNIYALSSISYCLLNNFRLKKDLYSSEQKLGIKKRWTKKKKKYRRHYSGVQKKKKLRFLHKMYENAVEYEFIRSLKGKYGGRLF